MRIIAGRRRRGRTRAFTSIVIIIFCMFLLMFVPCKVEKIITLLLFIHLIPELNIIVIVCRCVRTVM